MKAFGYRRDDDDAEQPLELREATLSASPKTLKVIAAFILQQAEAMERCGAKYDHAHLRDSWPGWRKHFADLIVARPIRARRT